MSSKVPFLLSTDSLGGYGLDLIFEIAKEAGFDGIDLALWKNFDARNCDYVKKLSTKHTMPVSIIQTSASINAKEMNQALDLCAALGATTININAPKFFDFKAYNYIIDNIASLRKHNEQIKFGIVNPANSSFYLLPIPEYRFTNLVEIIKKYSCYLGLDISNVSEDALESEFFRKIGNFIPHLSAIYFSDKTKLGVGHVIPGEGDLKLASLLKKLKQNKFDAPVSLKITIDRKDLADNEKVLQILKKCRAFFKEYYEEIQIEESAASA